MQTTSVAQRVQDFQCQLRPTAFSQRARLRHTNAGAAGPRTHAERREANERGCVIETGNRHQDQSGEAVGQP